MLVRSLLETLLDFSAKSEEFGGDGVTPLIRLARGNSSSYALLYQRYGANINAEYCIGWTPSLAAVSQNNHRGLKLLHEYWFENVHPVSKGADLL